MRYTKIKILHSRLKFPAVGLPDSIIFSTVIDVSFEELCYIIIIIIIIIIIVIIYCNWFFTLWQ
jgi:hypothetical protein